jgi:hypothetical protein
MPRWVHGWRGGGVYFPALLPPCGGTRLSLLPAGMAGPTLCTSDIRICRDPRGHAGVRTCNVESGRQPRRDAPRLARVHLPTGADGLREASLLLVAEWSEPVAIMVLGLLVIFIVCLVLGALAVLLVVRIRKSGGESSSRSSLTTWTGSPSSSLGAQGRSAALPGRVSCD